MPNRLIYLKSHNRRPLLLPGPDMAPDVQGRLPRDWCARCGAEVFTESARLCRRCKRRNRDE